MTDKIRHENSRFEFIHKAESYMKKHDLMKTHKPEYDGRGWRIYPHPDGHDPEKAKKEAAANFSKQTKPYWDSLNMQHDRITLWKTQHSKNTITF